MGQAADRDGAAARVDEVFDHPAFASLKSRAAAFVVVRPATRELIWANAAAAGFWGRSPDRLGSALFGPPGGGWLGIAARAVVPGRSPQMFRTGFAPGFGMRGSMVLARAVAPPDGEPIVGFAVPATGADGAPPEAWRHGADATAAAPAADEPLTEITAARPENAAPAGDGAAAAGSALARRSQRAILRDRLAAATDGAAALRFLWRTDARGMLTAIDAVVPSRLGAPLGPGPHPLPEAVALFDGPAGERLGRAFEGRSTWSGIAVRLPVAQGAAITPTRLAGSPVFGPDRSFEGFRGFGVIDLAGLEVAAREARPADDAASPRPRETGSAEGGSETPAPAADAPTPERASSLEDPAGPAETPDPGAGAEPAPRDDAPNDAAPDPATAARAPFANVVDLRSFQTTRSAPSATQDAAPDASPGTAPDTLPSPEAPVGDEAAFLALAAALRAQIGEGETGERSHDAVPPGGTLPSPTSAEAHGPDCGEASPPAVAAAVPLLDRLPVPVLVLRDGETAFANRAAARVLGFAAPGDLVGVAAPPAMGGTASGLTLRNGRGEAVTVAAEAIPVDWQGTEATLWTFRAGSAERRPDADPPVPAAQPEDDDRPVDLIDRVDDAVALLDRHGRIRRLNERGRSWFGGAILGEGVTALLVPESRAAALQLLEEARERGEGSAAAPPRREVLARTADGTAMPALLTLGPLGSAGFYATLRDVSALRRAERDEAQSRDRHARDAGRLPDLLARVSHEIRTPLNAILGFAEVMMDERFGPLGNPRYRDYLKDIRASGTQVVTLVDDLLDLSRIEAGRLDLEVTAVDVNKVVAELVAQMQPEANRGRVIVRTSLASRIPAVLADERSARQIVQHLLSNAVKFNEPGGQVIVSTAQDESGAVLLRIRDTGVGMTEAEIAAALEPFHDVSPPRPANGNGLGLPLARALVGANGASLAIRSRPREGTLVEVSFPPVPSEEARRPA